MVKEFTIPDIAYQIPLKEFFTWYDTCLAKKWDEMTNEDRNQYFKKADIKSLKENTLNNLGKHAAQDVYISDIQKAVTAANIMELKNPPLQHKEAHQVYFRIIEFTKLENNMDALHDAMTKFLAEKAISKMLRKEKENEL